jgi:hypothetical protein
MADAGVRHNWQLLVQAAKGRVLQRREDIRPGSVQPAELVVAPEATQAYLAFTQDCAARLKQMQQYMPTEAASECLAAASVAMRAEVKAIALTSCVFTGKPTLKQVELIGNRSPQGGSGRFTASFPVKKSWLPFVRNAAIVANAVEWIEDLVDRASVDPIEQAWNTAACMIVQHLDIH